MELEEVIDEAFKSGQREAIITIKEAILTINKSGYIGIVFHEKLGKFMDDYYNNLISLKDAKKKTESRIKGLTEKDLGIEKTKP